MLLTVSDIFMLLLSALMVTVGLSIMWSNKFYKHSSMDMLFATEFKVFLSGLLLLLIGVYGLINICTKIL